LSIGFSQGTGDKERTDRRGRTRERDGVYQREDRPGWWISFTDAKGQRKRRKVTGAHTLQQARAALGAELQNVERARIYGIAPPSAQTFSGIAARYLTHQKARLTPAAYERTRGIVGQHLKPLFGPMKISDIRRADVQRYVTQRCGEVSPGSVAREMNVLKRFFSLCIEWELIVVNPAAGVKLPRVPAGGYVACSRQNSGRCWQPAPSGYVPSWGSR
jgi:hypothetical protein